MGLTTAQRGILGRVRLLGAGGQAVALTEAMCVYLLTVIVRDLGLRARFPELPARVPKFFSPGPLTALVVEGREFLPLYERLLKLNGDADTYFVCLATLHKARLKYERILQTQTFPTLDQVGPRGLLQFGAITPKALTTFLFWRKWFFDIDNRAGQETGYLFEPILANALGGTPAPATKSPVKRTADPEKGRQVDCMIDGRAYEFKLRVTMAASGQGRWKEELAFPVDCRNSGFTPVLIVLDATENSKLKELREAFIARKGEVYTGAAAWRHLRSTAGETMGRFIERYVSRPIRALLADPPQSPPELHAVVSGDFLTISMLDQQLRIKRAPGAASDENDQMPEDADQQLPGA